jgi:subtilisin
LFEAALNRNDISFKTGRYIVTFRKKAVDEGITLLESKGFSVANAPIHKNKLTIADVGDKDALVFPGIRSALISSPILQELGVSEAEISAEGSKSGEGPIEVIEPEYFKTATNNEYLRGFISAATTIAKDLGIEIGATPGRQMIKEVTSETGDQIFVDNATWGLAKCKVPSCQKGGSGIKVAILDTGLDIDHPDFAGRSITTETFVGQPVQDLHGHGTHTTGSACALTESSDMAKRYGIAYECQIVIGKVLNNSGRGVDGDVLNGIQWAISEGCQVINMSLSAPTPVSTAYTTAGSEAISNGCLIIAAAGNSNGPTESPANSPNIMSVAALSQTLTPASFSCHDKIDIAAPGVDIYSSLPRPMLHGIKNGTSMAAPHVAGCAALWAQSDSTLRGINLWKKLQSSALSLDYPLSKVGYGLVQAPC